MDIPRAALSIRQPWAWAILYAGKDIENRSPASVRHMPDIKGRIAIHAAIGMTRHEYLEASYFMAGIGVECPPAYKLRRGGIVGAVTVVDVVKESESPWFFGPRGLVLENAEPCDFIPVKGSLGLFDWRAHRTDAMPKAARWMLPQDDRRAQEETPDLFSEKTQ